MKFFSSTQISWSEPWFFLQRIRERSGWLKRLALALVIAGIMFAAMHFFPNAPQALPIQICLALACGFVLVASMELPYMQRDVTVKEDCIIVGSTGGRGRFDTFKFEDIEAVEILRIGEGAYKWPVMILEQEDEGFMTAISSKVRLETLADILHRLELTVGLTGWTPSDTDTRIAVRNEMTMDPDRVRGHIEVSDITDSEPRLMTGLQMALTGVIAAGPLLASLIGAIAVGVFTYRNWDTLSTVKICLWIGGAILALVLSFMYLMRIGQFISARYGISRGLKRMQSRTSPFFSGTEDDLLPIEIFDRESWTSVISQATDYGFLRIDRTAGLLKYEGNKSRWTMPVSSIASCCIEESIVGSEADDKAERRFFVVLVSSQPNQEKWEEGMVFVRTEMGKDDRETRYARSKLLFDQLIDVCT